MIVLEMCPKGCLVSKRHSHAIVTPEEVEQAAFAPFGDEYAVEVEWADHKAAGAPESTSVYGWYPDLDMAERALESGRLKREIARQRVLTRRAAYTEIRPYAGWIKTTEGDRERIFREQFSHYPRES